MSKIKKGFLSLVITTVFFLSSPLFAEMQAKNGQQIKVAVVNFKSCVENSKIGKEEQENFEKMKKQMETILQEKEKVLNDLAEKANDPNYLDSISPEAETDLKRKLRALSQEMAQLQNQYFQALNQANFKVVQKLTDIVSEASKTVAKNSKLDLILNEEGSFFYSPSLDISKSVIQEMDQMFEKGNLGKADAEDGHVAQSNS